MHSARRLATPVLLAFLIGAISPAGAGPASASTSGLQLAANCEVNVRARPTTLSAKKTRIAANTVVMVSGKVSGRAYRTVCQGWVAGSTWYAIAAIGGRSVSSLFGVRTVYAASALFRAAPIVLEGIDVSRWQGRVDFAMVRASGKRFVIAKATEGRYYTDDAYARNRSGAIAAGLAFSAYHYAHPDRTPADAILEADHFLAVAGLRHGMLAPVLDVEDGSSLGVSGLQAWVKTWLSRVYSRTGVRAMIYTTPYFWQTSMGNTRWFADNGYRVVWVAHWNASVPIVPASRWSGRSWSFWQYSDCGSVPGISSCVDLDRFRGTDLSAITF
jgi:lysozyme